MFIRVINVFLSRFKQLMTAIMLLIFAGQVTAAAVIPCKMMTQQQSTSMDMTLDMQGMDHSSQQMDVDMTADSGSNFDCCDPKNNCSMSGCVIAAPPVLPNPVFIKASAQKINLYTSLALSQASVSLHRPPISR